MNSSVKPNTFVNSMMGLENTVESKELNNISVPFCFICLLHLANEQNLILKADECEFGGDFSIYPESSIVESPQKVQDVMVLVE